MDRAVITLFCLLSVVFIAAQIVFSWPAYWKYALEESGPLTWLESLLLFLIAVLSFLCAGLEYVGGSRDSVRWAVLASAFAALCLDERFAIHERIRDQILAPMNTRLIFFWVSPGDIVLLLAMLAGLVFLLFILRMLRERQSAMVLFLLAVALSAAAVILDSFDFHRLSVEELRLEQFAEEMIESAAMILFACAVYLILSGKLLALAGLKRRATDRRES
jgi:hypothetical protein